MRVVVSNKAAIEMGEIFFGNFFKGCTHHFLKYNVLRTNIALFISKLLNDWYLISVIF